jgi:hypothetical protein
MVLDWLLCCGVLTGCCGVVLDWLLWRGVLAGCCAVVSWLAAVRWCPDWLLWRHRYAELRALLREPVAAPLLGMIDSFVKVVTQARSISRVHISRQCKKR